MLVHGLGGLSMFLLCQFCLRWVVTMVLLNLVKISFVVAQEYEKSGGEMQSLGTPVASESDLRSAWDGSVAAAGRTYPLGGGFSAAGGKSWRLWGDVKDPQGWRFGFVRLGADITSAGAYNGGGLSVDFHPISFINLRAGRAWNSNSREYEQFDCVRIDCTGSRSKDFVELRLAAKWNESFFSIRAKREWHERAGFDSRFFGDPESALVLSPSGRDRLCSSTVVLGQSVREHWSVFLAQTEFTVHSSDQRSSQNVVGVLHSHGEWTYSAAVGYWDTNSSQPKLTAMGLVSFTPNPKWISF